MEGFVPAKGKLLVRCLMDQERVSAGGVILPVKSGRGTSKDVKRGRVEAVFEPYVIGCDVCEGEGLGVIRPQVSVGDEVLYHRLGSHGLGKKLGTDEDVYVVPEDSVFCVVQGDGVRVGR